jgi:hypothetical protein
MWYGEYMDLPKKDVPRSRQEFDALCSANGITSNYLHSLSGGVLANYVRLNRGGTVVCRGYSLAVPGDIDSASNSALNEMLRRIEG